jgi:hypothetical protein
MTRLVNRASAAFATAMGHRSSSNRRVAGQIGVAAHETDYCAEYLLDDQSVWDWSPAR